MRRKKDNYPTPSWVSETLLRHYPLRGSRILEPCAGGGAIVEVVKRHNPAAHVTAVEIREEEWAALGRSADETHIADFLTWRPTGRYDAIITNPPFCIAQQVIERAFEIADGTEIIMFLRLGFLESRRRIKFWRRHPLSRLYVLADRPSFEVSGTDKSAYAWYVWNAETGQRVEIVGRPGAVNGPKQRTLDVLEAQSL